MHPSLRLVADRQLGVFTGRDARRAGYDDEEIRALLGRREWSRLRRGVYIPSERLALLRSDPTRSHLLDAVAVLVSLDEGPVLSHDSAARFHGLPVPHERHDVRLTDSVQWRTGRGYRVARAMLPPEDLAPFLRFRTTGVGRTLVDCARGWSMTLSVVAMDAALFGALINRQDLTAAVLAGRHRVGIGGTARALGLADGRAESPLETRGRLALLSGGLPPPELQVELHDERGMAGRVDAWYDHAAVAIEFDGLVKYTQPRGGRSPAQVLWEEKRREDRVRALGVRVVRIVDEDLRRGWPAVIERIAALLATPWAGPRRFTVVRTAEPGTPAAA